MSQQELTKTQKEIISIISEIWVKHPELRFGQLLYNLDINQFANQNNPDEANHQLRNIHPDSDSKILSRVKNSVMYKLKDDENE